MPKSLSPFNGACEESILNEFNKNGFYLHRGMFSQQVAGDAATWLKNQPPHSLVKSWTEQEPGVPLAVYTVVHKGKDPIAQITTDPKILEIAGKLMGKPTYIWASKVNMKVPWCGTVEYYHQDFVYWKDRGYPKDDMLTCIVFLEKHNIHNAALHVLPGTHRFGFIPHQSFININGLSKRMIPPDKLDQLYKDHGLVVIDAEPGDALFFHVSLIHGSSHNISPDGRMTLFSQLNTVGNEPNDVSTQARQFNILRAKEEVEEAGRRLHFFKEKYKKQMASDDPTFCAPIPDHEK
jgi:ectoine hydroxylase-related dioxygenase (phytanoyl-CoA dioxygenase family)